MSALENNVSNRTFEELFASNVQFEIPFFQRGYVWGSTHWNQLFSDITEQILPELEDLDENELCDDRVKDAEHFFGPIVVLQKKNAPLGLQSFLVIDGQQRITTIYLLLATIKNKLAEKAHESEKVSEYCNALEQCVVNKLIGDNADDYTKLKVLSTKGDRLPTYYLVFGDKNPYTPQLSVDQQMYNPAKNNIIAFRKYLDRKLKKECNDASSLWRLAQVLLKSLKIVWIG